MTDLRGRHQPGRILAIATFVCGLLSSAILPVLRAEEPVRPAGSLNLVPENAAFYSSMLRGREQIEAIGKSRAWAKLMAMPVTKMGLDAFKKEFTEEGKLAFLYNLYKMPENKQLLELLGEMFSDEVFIYGGESWEGFVGMMQDVIGSAYYGSIVSSIRLGGGGGNVAEAMGRHLLEALDRNANNLKIPDLVIGFKLKKKDRAEAQIKRLEGLLKALAKQVPQLKGSVKREKIGAASFLTFSLNGEMVPWDMIPIKNLEEKEGQFDNLLKKLKAMKLTLAIGVREDYLLFSLGESTAPLHTLGQGKLLADRAEFKPLAKYADKRLTSIGYISKSMNQVVSTSKKTADSLVAMVKGFIPAGLEEKQKAQIDKDLKDLAGDLKKFLPDPGAVTAFSFMNGRGYESYQYDWSTYPQQDGSKPLSLLNHLGGNPLFATVGRSRGSAEQYRFLVKVLKVGYRYVEEYAIPQLPEQIKEGYDKFAKKVFPVLKKVDDVTTKMLLPALKDGQVGFVLDAKIKSKQWLKLFPATEKELPMIEPAFLLGLSDAALFRKAFSEYRSLANIFLGYCLDLAPGKIPELKISKPASKKIEAGELYFYLFPEEWGIDKQIVLNGGVGEKVAVFSISLEHSKRLLTSTPLKVKGGPLGNTKRPLASATYFNFAGLMDAASPWIDLGAQAILLTLLRDSREGEADEKAAKKTRDDVIKQVHTVVEVLKVLRSYASVTYLEDGVWVSHSETIIRDIPAEKE